MNVGSTTTSAPRQVIALVCALLALGLGAQSATAATPVVAAAGDIACAPESPYFNQTFGTSENCHMRQTAAVVRRIAPNQVLALGDTQYESGAFSAFLQSYDPTWGQFTSITRPVVGNHEYRTPGAAGYFRYFGTRAGDPHRGYYTYRIGAWRIIALNSNCEQVGGCHSTSRQAGWLRSVLANNTSRCTLALMHHPRFSSGSHGSDARLKYLWSRLSRARVEAVVGGHEHDYERFGPQDAWGNSYSRGPLQFVVGTGGKSLRSFGQIQPNSRVRESSTYGALKLSLSTSRLYWRFVPEQGKTFSDSGSRACS